MKIQFSGDIEKVITDLAGKTGLSATAVIENILIGVLAESAARVEHSGDENRGFIVALQLTDDMGNIVRGDELFEKAKLLKLMELNQIDELSRLAGDKVFENIPARGSC
jgi:cytochrome c556